MPLFVLRAELLLILLRFGVMLPRISLVLLVLVVHIYIYHRTSLILLHGPIHFLTLVAITGLWGNRGAPEGSVDERGGAGGFRATMTMVVEVLSFVLHV